MSASLQVKNIMKNMRAWENTFKIGSYDGLNIIAQKMEENLKATHSSTAWFNEPVGRTPGDLESTYVGLVQAALGDNKFNLGQSLSDEGAMRNWGAKTMTEETEILSRTGDPKGKLGEYAMENWHDEPEVYKWAALPFIARAIITSPMKYAYFTEMGNEEGGSGYPVLNAVVNAVGLEVVSVLSKTIRARLKSLTFE